MIVGRVSAAHQFPVLLLTRSKVTTSADQDSLDMAPPIGACKRSTPLSRRSWLLGACHICISSRCHGDLGNLSLPWSTERVA